jgi:hypothetical protein
MDMGRRANSEGSVRQRSDNRREARVSYVDPATGRRRSASFYGPTAEAARAALETARGRIKVEAPLKDSTVRLADSIEHWSKTTLEASSRKASTREWYRGLARKHLAPAPLGTTPLDKLRKSHVDGLIVGLRAEGLSDSTVRGVYTVLRARSSRMRAPTGCSPTIRAPGCLGRGSVTARRSTSAPATLPRCWRPRTVCGIDPCCS